MRTALCAPSAHKPWWLAAQALCWLVCIAAATWQASALSITLWAAAALACTASAWAWQRGHLQPLEGLMLQAAALATASSATGPWYAHVLLKPSVMLFAIIFVAVSARKIRDIVRFDSKSWWLLGVALAGSLAGDAFLLWSEAFFIPGLVSFLLAHLAYLALFARGVPWFAQRLSLLATLGVGAGAYAFLWLSGLPAELRIPVAVYVSAIALMAAQALGRAAVLQERPARQVALGACLFMLSDTILATDRFALPIPLAQVGVLATYYAAQAFIVHGMVRGLVPGLARTA